MDITLVQQALLLQAIYFVYFIYLLKMLDIY